MPLADGSFAATKKFAIWLVALLRSRRVSNERTETEKELRRRRRGALRAKSNAHISVLNMTGGVGGMGGSGENSGTGGSGGNGEGAHLIADTVFVGNLVVNAIPRGVSDPIFYVMDPVGGHFPVSLRYCHVYADLDRIIKAYLCGRREAGADYVERGDYAVVLGDGSFIAPVEFAEKVGTDMRLEMSILQLRVQNESDAIQNTICPYCSCSHATETGGGWYKCTNNKCSRNYRIDGQDQNSEDLTSPQVALPDETYAFRRVHIRFMYLVNTPMVPGWSRPGMIEDYTPSIHIEPPPDSDEQDLFASLGAFDNFDNYGPTSQSGMNDGYPTVPALFIQGSELPSSGRSDLWSPVSSFSGDVFPDDFSSDDFAPHWSQHSQQFSGYSSPALSPSLSPLTSAFDGFALDERYPAGDQSVLSSGPAIHWLNADPFPNSLGTAMSWGPAQTDMHRNANNNNTMSTPGNLVAGWRYPASDERPPADSHSDRPPPSPSRLTVPVVGLQRRGVGALQRSRAHSDLAALLPDQDTGRGRGQHRTALSIPNSRSVNNGS